MARPIRLTATAVFFALVFQIASMPMAAAGGQNDPTAAASQDAVKSAFDSAKELGTADAWNAFLANYPTGFYADMARAYLKKASDPASGSASAPAPATPPPNVSNAQPAAAAPSLPASSARAGERSCSELQTFRSQHSREPTKITFVNQSGMYRALMWIDFDGTLKDYGGLNSGEEMVLDTFRTHPWMIATGPGDCLQIFLPAAEPSIVRLERLAADDAPVRTNPVVQKQSEPKKVPPPQKLKCGKNYKLKNGECVLVQNCGQNAYRSAEGDCYCKKGYERVKGKCRWPQDNQGFEVAPWKKQGCSGWQAQCNQGNNEACGNYEANCQVN